VFREGVFDHHRRDAVAAVAAAAGGQPLIQGTFGPCPEGYAWYVELATFLVAGNAHNAIGWLAVTPDNGPLPSFAGWDGYGLAIGSGAAAVGGPFSLPLPLYVPPGHWVRCLLQGGTLANGDAATFTFQTAVHQLDPLMGMMTPEETAEVLAAHEHVGAELASPAVAGRRAV
jgi:hypothetical protein